MQSTLTDFRYLRKIWSDNTAEERLLGVSLTGIMDHPVLNGSGEVFRDVRILERERNPQDLLWALRRDDQRRARAPDDDVGEIGGTVGRRQW